MTQSNVIAKYLYNTALKLKTLDKKSLVLSKARCEFISDLTAIQTLIYCIGKTLSAEQTALLADSLKRLYGIKGGELLKELNAASQSEALEKEQEELLLKMTLIVSACLKSVSERKKGFIESANKFVLAFHNLPRAFFDSSDPAAVSPESAWEYSAPYFKV